MAAALAVEEACRAAGSAKVRGLGIPLPFTDHDGTATVVRLWAKWWKRPSGAAQLRSFEARLGRERSGKELITLNVRPDGSLHCQRWLFTDHAGFTITVARLRELQRRLDEAEAAAGEAEPLSAMAKRAVAEGGATFCCICGRTLTDPVSVETGIGPECGSGWQAAFRDRWNAARRARR